MAREIMKTLGKCRKLWKLGFEFWVFRLFGYQESKGKEKKRKENFQI